MSKPEIIGSSRSTYTRVVRMVCEEKGIDHTLTDVPLGAPELAAIHPPSRRLVRRAGQAEWTAGASNITFVPAPTCAPGMSIA